MPYHLPVYIERFTLVNPSDDAIDPEGSDIAKYVETLDPAHLKLVDGRQPVVFDFRSPTLREIAGHKSALIDEIGVDAIDKPHGEKMYAEAVSGLRKCILKISGDYPVDCKDPRWTDCLSVDECQTLWSMVKGAANAPFLRPGG